MGQDGEAFSIHLTPLDDLKLPSTSLLAPPCKLLAAVGPIRPDLLQAGHQWIPSGEQQARSYPILNVCSRDINREWKTQGIYQQVPLAALDVLVGVVAARSGPSSVVLTL
jgi:hypothetical protein